jgi:hypothetical protein
MATTKSIEKQKDNAYSFEDAMGVADDIFNLQKTEKYNAGAFIHGLIFALEVTQQSYQIPPQQLAQVKRSVRKYVKELITTQQKK